MDYETEIRRLKAGMGQMAEDLYGPEQPDVIGGGRDHTLGIKGMVKELWDRGANGGPGLQVSPKWTRREKLAAGTLFVSSLSSSVFVIVSVLG